MSDKLGKDCKAYVGSALLAGTNQAAISAVTWSEMSNVKDVTQNLSKATTDKTTRGSGGWRQKRSTLKEGTVEFEANWDTADAQFAALVTAWENDTEISCAFMDGDIATAGSKGLVSNFTVADLSRSEPLEGMVTVKVKLEPSSQSKWATITT